MQSIRITPQKRPRPETVEEGCKLVHSVMLDREFTRAQLHALAVALDTMSLPEFLEVAMRHPRFLQVDVEELERDCEQMAADNTDQSIQDMSESSEESVGLKDNEDLLTEQLPGEQGSDGLHDQSTASPSINGDDELDDTGRKRDRDSEDPDYSPHARRSSRRKRVVSPASKDSEEVEEAALLLLHGPSDAFGAESKAIQRKRRKARIGADGTRRKKKSKPSKPRRRRFPKSEDTDARGMPCHWPDCEEQCPHNSDTPYRKVVSDCFGRNVACLKGEVPWIYVCRRRYQRQKYRGLVGELRARMFTKQLELWKEWGGFTDFVLYSPPEMVGEKNIDELIAYAKRVEDRVLFQHRAFPKVVAFPKTEQKVEEVPVKGKRNRTRKLPVVDNSVSNDDANALLALAAWQPSSPGEAHRQPPGHFEVQTWDAQRVPHR